MSNSYVENFSTPVDFPKPLQRTGKFPLDRTTMFSSYEDAVKYAAGNREDPDSRGLCGTSYVGQTITVYENGVVADYKILDDRSLRKISIIDTLYSTLEIGELSKEIQLPAGGQVLTTSIFDSSTGEQILTDVVRSEDTITISLADAYDATLEIMISYYAG